MLVRPAESASVERSPLRDADIPEGLPERMTPMLTEVKAIPDDADDYRAADRRLGRTGRRLAVRPVSPEEVIERSRPRGADEAEAAACFELGQHLPARPLATTPRCRGGDEAHRLDPENWTYKRQAWTLVTTPPGTTENDLIQGPNDVYEGNWLDDVIAAGGGAAYTSSRSTGSGLSARRRVRRSQLGSASERPGSVPAWSTCAGCPSPSCARRRWCAAFTAGTTPATPRPAPCARSSSSWGATRGRRDRPGGVHRLRHRASARPPRPTAQRTIVWPTVGVWSASTPGGDVLLALGPEPALRWKLFCAQFVGIAERFEVRMVDHPRRAARRRARTPDRCR